MLVLAFATTTLREICENDVKAESMLGTKVASSLRPQLADLQAAGTIYDVLVGNVRDGGATDGSEMLVDIADGWTLKFRANHPRNPKTAAGLVNWSKVSRIQLLKLEKEND